MSLPSSQVCVHRCQGNPSTLRPCERCLCRLNATMLLLSDTSIAPTVALHTLHSKHTHPALQTEWEQTSHGLRRWMCKHTRRVGLRVSYARLLCWRWCWLPWTVLRTWCKHMVSVNRIYFKPHGCVSSIPEVSLCVSVVQVQRISIGIFKKA